MQPTIILPEDDPFEPQQVPLPRKLLRLERKYGQANYRYRLFHQIKRALDEYPAIGNLPPQAIEVILRPGDPSIPDQVWEWMSDDDKRSLFEVWLTQQIYQHWSSHIDRGAPVASPPHLTVVRIIIAEEGWEAEDVLHDGGFDLGAIWKKFSRWVFGLHDRPEIVTARRLEVDFSARQVTPPDPPYLQLLAGADLLPMEGEPRLVDHLPFIIGQSRSSDWQLEDRGRFPLVGERHAVLEWDGARCWLQNIGIHEIWMFTEGNWVKVQRGKPIPLDDMNVFCLGRMAQGGPLLGSAWIQYRLP